MPSSLLILQKGPLGFQCTFKNQKSKQEFFSKESKSGHIVNNMLKDMIICREINQYKNSKGTINTSPNNFNTGGQVNNQFGSGAIINSGCNSSSNLFFKNSADENYRWMKETQNLYDLLKYKSDYDEKEGTFFSYKDQYYDVKIVWKNSRQILVLLNNISEKINAEKLQELDQYKDKLLASVCHDIKTPVCQLIQFLNFALEKGANLIPKDSRNFIEISLKTTGLLMYLISDILDYSQIKKKIFRLRIDKFNLNDVLEEVIDLFRFQAEQKGLKISRKFNQGSFTDVNNIQVNNDANRIKQVLINLISNALKFTQKGQIIINISTSEEKSNIISISVKDSGIGMSDEIKARLFQQYSTFNQEGLNKNGGHRYRKFRYFIDIDDQIFKMEIKSIKNFYSEFLLYFKIKIHQQKKGIGLGLNNCKTIVGELGPTNQFQVESLQNEGSTFTFQVFQNNLKYAEQIKEEEEEDHEEESVDQTIDNQQQQTKNSYIEDKEAIKQNYKQFQGDLSQDIIKLNKNQQRSTLTQDELLCRVFQQNNDQLTSKDKNSTIHEFSNQSGNIIFDEISPSFLPNQYESPVKKVCGQSKVGVDLKRLQYQKRLSKQDSNNKSNLNDSQEIHSFDMMSIQEYHYSHPPNQVYPSLNFQTSQLLQSCKHLDSKQNDLSPQLIKKLSVNNEKRVSFISSYIKKTISNQAQPTTEEASQSDQSSTISMSSGLQSVLKQNSSQKKIILQNQSSLKQTSSPKEKGQKQVDDFIAIRNQRYSVASTKIHNYQNYKSNSQYNRMSKEFDNKQILNRQKISKSDISKKKSNSFLIQMQQRNTHENFQVRTKHNILIVDDNYFNILALKLLISENENIIVYQAENGEQAVQKVEQMQFKIIFMDMMMPIMDGETSARIMKQDLKFVTPIISLTANDYTEEEKKSLPMFDDFLNKPIQKQKVQEILERYKLI